MKRKNSISWLVVSGLFLSMVAGAGAVEKTIDELVVESKASVIAAQQAVDDARQAVEQGKTLIQNLPGDAMMITEVKEMLVASSQNWKIAVESLAQAESSAQKLDGVSDQKIASDYALLTQMNANVAKSGAQVVTTALLFVEAAANQETQSFDTIRLAMQEVQAAATQVRFHSEKVISLIEEEYSN